MSRCRVQVGCAVKVRRPAESSAGSGCLGGRQPPGQRLSTAGTGRPWWARRRPACSRVSSDATRVSASSAGCSAPMSRPTSWLRVRKAGAQRVMAAKLGEAAEVRVGRHHRATVFDRHRGVLGVCDELPRGVGPGLVLLRVDRSRPVQIDSGPGPDASRCDEPERRHRGSWLTALEGVVQDPGDEGAHTDPASVRGPAHLYGEPVVEGDRRPDDASA